MTLATDMHELVRDATRAHGVPGAAVGVLTDDRETVMVSGVLDAGTRAPVQPRSLFQLGSITKAYTATAVMALAAAGRFDLDAPVADVLPGFAVADPDVTDRVTPRHLLTHTSGIGGDHLADYGDGDDCVEAFVDGLGGLGQDVPLGTIMSYSNTGYVVLGRMLEVLTGLPYGGALRGLVLDPLGLADTVTGWAETVGRSVARGHVGGVGGEPVRPAGYWSAATPALGPAGGLCASAADVLAFARAHLADDRGMRTPQVVVPDPWSTGSHWGLGWILDTWNGRPVFGHDGDTGVQAAHLRVLADAGTALVLLTNGGDARGLWGALCGELLDARAPTPPAPSSSPVPAGTVAALAGTYVRLGMRIDIEEIEGELRATTAIVEPLASQLSDDVPPQRAVLRATDRPGAFLAGERTLMVRVELDGERYLHTGARMLRRVGS